ncbi:hypothetical protein [Flavobacterium sp.]|jgi:tetratricopeptide (TPR) repeat protein|uniref:tetratricopeptide repeat protein n=1 Tax=Flavobacterium sp. TaxID=239 RepID=UPI0022BA823E|nr:hypothetical protein [Flavobacterium sp.]MCZ8143682.1 hypothetical protein [Flavobacterium sp.]MCZ8368204.1 hypothetical protein [Flavobacterium sp.]
MKRYLALFVFLSTTFGFAQAKLVFDKRFVQCEDKWVAFQADSTGSHTVGFIYIDAQAGLTLNYEGSFTIDENGTFHLKKKESNSAMKVRLKPNNVYVSLIPEEKLTELGLNVIPDWLKFYKENENTVERQYRWGYMYNAWGECEKALEFLNKAYLLNPKYKGLKVELAYSYNCMKNYSKAIELLTLTLHEEPATAYIVKELIFAQAQSGDAQKAENTYTHYLPIITDTTYKAENAFNILQGYYFKKDLKNFQRWLVASDLKSDKRLLPYVERMVANLKE